MTRLQRVMIYITIITAGINLGMAFGLMAGWF